MELISILQTQIGQSAVNAVNARELHSKLEIKSRFNDWINNRLKDFTQDEDFIVVTKNLVTEGNDFILSLDTAKHIAMIERSEIGKKIRQYFIECEKKVLAIPTDPLELLRVTFQALDNQSAKLAQFDNRVALLENTSTLDYSQQQKVNAAVKSKVSELLIKHSLDKAFNKKLFSGVYKTIQSNFEVSSYKDIPKVKFDLAIEFIISMDFKQAVS